MNYRANPSSPSLFLQGELDRLQSLSDAVRASGSVAPANCWVSEIEQIKNGRTYRYAKLISASKQMRSRLLGRPGCESDRDWRSRCQRRAMIAEIEQQMRLLVELIDRQMLHPIEFQTDEVEILHGKNFDSTESLSEVPCLS